MVRALALICGDRPPQRKSFGNAILCSFPMSQENTSLTVLLYPYVDRIDAYKKMRHKRIHDTGLALGK